MSSLDFATHPELTETIALLKARPRTVTLEDIAKATSVSVSWLTQLASNKITEPSFNKVMRVRDYLNNSAKV